MSWQEEYVARYEARLRERWTRGGKCISNPWDTVSANATGYKIPFEEAKMTHHKVEWSKDDDLYALYALADKMRRVDKDQQG